MGPRALPAGTQTQPTGQLAHLFDKEASAYLPGAHAPLGSGGSGRPAVGGFESRRLNRPFVQRRPDAR